MNIPYSVTYPDKWLTGNEIIDELTRIYNEALTARMKPAAILLDGLTHIEFERAMAMSQRMVYLDATNSSILFQNIPVMVVESFDQRIEFAYSRYDAGKVMYENSKGERIVK